MYEYLFCLYPLSFPQNCPINNPLHILAPPPVLFQIFLWKGFKYKQFPAQKIIQIQNVPQCSAANNECFILLNIHYLIQQTNNLEFFCMRIPLNFSSFFVLKTLKKYNILCGFSQDFYFRYFDNGPVQSLNSPKVKHSMEIIDFVASLLRYPTALWIFNYQFTECIWLNRVNTTTSTKKPLYTEQKKIELILIFSSIYSSSSFFPVFPPKWKQNNY